MHPVGRHPGSIQSSPTRSMPVSSHNSPHAKLATSSFRTTNFPSSYTSFGIRRSPGVLRQREQAWTATKDCHFTHEDIWHVSGPRTPTIGRPWMESRSTDLALSVVKPKTPLPRPRSLSPSSRATSWDSRFTVDSSLDLMPVHFGRQEKPPLPESVIQAASLVRHQQQQQQQQFTKSLTRNIWPTG